MTKKFSTLIGALLILFGVLLLTSNLLVSIFGFHIPWFRFWRLWPVIVLAIGSLFVAVPLLFREKRGLGALYIPGIPILTTGGILFFASTLDMWGAWEYLWPLEVLGLAVGFLLAAFSTGIVWFGIPAIIIGINGLILQFCAITGWWSAWSFLWALEPAAIGLILLLISTRAKSKAPFIVGVSICAFAVVAFISMAALTTTGWWAFRYVGPLLLIAGGVLLLLAGVLKQPPSTTNSVISEGNA